MHMIIVVGVSTETDNPLMHDVCVDLFPPPPPPRPAVHVYFAVCFIRGRLIFRASEADVPLWRRHILCGGAAAIGIK